MLQWGFYGRTRELQELVSIFKRGRFFFARVTGRRRIGKTTLVQQALRASGRTKIFYVQIPDSAPAGVLSAVADAMDTFQIPSNIERPDSLLSLATLVEKMVRSGYVIALDEFQYFSRKHLHEFLSHLQAVVDRLLATPGSNGGGLIVLGSLHAELVALLEDRDAPLYNRTTDQLELQHLDIASILQILEAHSDPTPERLLFLWGLFEGVPKFYRDCFEQGVLAASREELLEQMFYGSSSPLRSEADHWFLSELRGRYDVVLKFVARNPGCTSGELTSHVREISPESSEQIGGYLEVLINKYGLIEKRLPIFSKPKARSGRYYVTDNFLRSWLGALHSSVSAVNFRPINILVKQADQKLEDGEGFAFEELVAELYAERSRKGVGDFSMTHRIEGFWDKKGTEIDIVALNEDDQIIRFITCKRDAAKLLGESKRLDEHVKRFLSHHKRFDSWRKEYVGAAPMIEKSLRARLVQSGLFVQDLNELTFEL